jgi:group I intron endonuclease
LNIGYIYKITNKINNKCYIGQTSKHYEQRWNEHKNIFNNSNSKEYNYPLYKAFRKYGIDNFMFEILEECNINNLDEKEIYWIKYYDSTNSKNGYNQSFGGSGHKTLDLDENKVIEKYNKIKNVSKTAQFFKCSNASISQILKKHNIKIISSEEQAKLNAYETICIKNGIEIMKFVGINDAAQWIVNNKKTKNIKNAFQNIRNAILLDITAYGYYWKCTKYTSEFKSEYAQKKRKNQKYKGKKHTNIKKAVCPICGAAIFEKSNLCQLCHNKQNGEKALKDKEQRHNVTRDILKQEIRTISFAELGKKYGVSDNAIKKWCKTYNLPYKKSDINNYSDKEWEDI